MDVKNLPLPTQDHIAWQDREMGVMLHWDLETFDPAYQPGKLETLPSGEVFHPDQLDTDQWLDTVAASGCRSAVMICKHASGFTFFPTKAHSFGVQGVSWRGGKGDVVAEFIASCERYHIKPGFYFSVGDNDYLEAAHHQMCPNAQRDWEEYQRLTLIQCEELWSRYADLGEIWFDGSIWPKDRGREKLEALVERYQPHALSFGADPATLKSIRHTGNEDGRTLDWSMSGSDGSVGVSYLENQQGKRDGRYWFPLESITPNRDNHTSFGCGWFYHDDEDHTLFSPEELLERYYQSVGRNANYMMGMVIDKHGLLPAADVRQFTEFGRLLRGQFETKIDECAGIPGEICYTLRNPSKQRVNLFEVTEWIEFGERITHYKIFGVDEAGREHPLYTGDCVSHKQLVRVPATAFGSYRLKIDGVLGEAHLKKVAMYFAPRA